MIDILDLQVTNKDGHPVFDHAELRLDKGVRVGVHGHHGTGKTLLIQLLMGEARPTRGEIKLDGLSLFSLPRPELFRLRKNVGYIPRDDALINNLPILENLVFPALYHALCAEAEALERALAAIDIIGMRGILHQMPGAISQGQRRILSAVRALVGRPKFMFGDDITFGLQAADLKILASLIEWSGRVFPDLCWFVTSLNHLSLEHLGLNRILAIEHGRFKGAN
ncbi:MAG: ATP-binding cassette domain-containing protein [Nitrospirae bacterium]|nr:ATP-binding cassette domain-containing protein [Nitrospirota bacterium]